MSTNIPPHNLGEVVDALKYMLERWDGLDDISVEDLMRFIQGPDFPTGGVIIQDRDDEEGLTSAYGAGRGRVVVQARAHFEEMGRGRSRIIVTELPYMVNKSSLLERIAELTREGHLEGLSDLRDESDRQGLRIVIELKQGAEPETSLNELYKSTMMRTTFGIIVLALVDGEPRLLGLKQALRVYLEHRLEVTKRRAEYDLEKARQRAHILEGLRVALQNLDAVIELIRKSTDADNARERLMKRFRLSEAQAQAILDMPLRRLAALERKKIEEEYKELQAQIKALEALLRSPRKMREVVADGLQEMKDTYGDRRRTQIVHTDGKTVVVSPVVAPAHVAWVMVTPDGLISRTHDDKPPKVSGAAAPRWLLRANTGDTLYLVTEQGEAAALPAHAVPEAENPAEGVPCHKVSPLTETDKLAALFALPVKEERAEGWFVFTATVQGMVKKTSLSELPGPMSKPFTLTKINESDCLGWVRLTDGKADILLATQDGLTIRFTEEDVRPMGLVAAGVNGIKLQGQDVVVGMDILPARGEVLLVTSGGKAKRVTATLFPTQGRYGQGVVAWKLSRTETLAGMAVGKPTTRLALRFDKLTPKTIRMDEAPLQTRVALGKPLVELKGGYKVVGLTLLWEAPRPIAGGGTVEVEEPDAAEPKPAPKAPKKVKEETQLTLEDALSPGKPKRVRKTTAAAKPAASKTTRQTAKPAAKPATAKSPAAKMPSAKTPATKPPATKSTKTEKATAKPTQAGRSTAKDSTKTAQKGRASTASKPAAKKPAGSAKEKTQPKASADKRKPTAPKRKTNKATQQETLPLLVDDKKKKKR
jgi:DNA gyrase subunit A